MKYVLLAALFFLSCAKKPHSDQPDDKTNLDLHDLKVSLTNEYVSRAENNVGHWPSDKDCDGALWAGIVRAGGLAVDIGMALTSEGRPTRRPLKDCGPANLGYPGDSAGTTSTDMMLGIIIGLFADNDLAGLQKMSAYAAAHGGIMGFPAENIAISLIKPGTSVHLARAIHALGGPASPWDSVPQIYTPPAHDYELHLELLSMYETAAAGARLNFEETQALIYEANHNPNDALAQALLGRKAEAAKMLLDPNWQVPHYVRGPETADIVHRLFVLKVISSINTAKFLTREKQ